MKPFSNLSLPQEMIKNLDRLDYKTMTPVQEKSIPVILKGHDIVAQAKTGSGKTVAYGIGLLHHLDFTRYCCQGLVLCPTRELAEQVTGEIRKLARLRHNIKVLKITGGFPLFKQEHSLSHKAHIVVGTPGRVLKLLERKSFVLDDVGMIVLDEADRMLDMGFIEQIEKILRFAPTKYQTLCFSATFPDEIRVFIRTFLRAPQEITVQTQHDSTVISQRFYKVSPSQKGISIFGLLAKHQPDSTLIFCNTKNACKALCKELNCLGLHCLSLHGDLEQKDRTETLIRFSNGSTRVLVATDVAARGLDIADLGAVINYDLPFEAETYIHRIGRTGRAGRKGLTFSLVEPTELHRLDRINEQGSSNYSAEHFDFKSDGKHPELKPSMVTLSINGGRKNKISAGDILGALTKDGRIQGTHVGKIDRLDYLTFVAIKDNMAKVAFSVLKSDPVKGRHFKVLRHDKVLGLD